jgi:hypothetical protein
MRRILSKFWTDDDGFIISTEMLFICVILVIGLVAGFTALRQGVVTELAAVGNAIGALDEGYKIMGMSSPSGVSFDTVVTHVPFTVSVSTDADGLYSFDTTNLDPNGQTIYSITVSVPTGYFLPFFPFNNPWEFFNPPDSGNNNDFAFANMQCTRIAERWVKKVCFLPSMGVRVTFDDRGKLFTALYPNTTIDDYNALIASPDKGVWIHHFYYKKKAYIPWAISP